MARCAATMRAICKGAEGEGWGCKRRGGGDGGGGGGSDGGCSQAPPAMHHLRLDVCERQAERLEFRHCRVQVCGVHRP